MSDTQTPIDDTINNAADIIEQFGEDDNVFDQVINELEDIDISMDNIVEKYDEWSFGFKTKKTIAGKLISEWYKTFALDISSFSVNDILHISNDAIIETTVTIMKKLQIAQSYYRTARLKYNKLVINATVKFMIGYGEEIESGEFKSMTKDKIKMIAESKQAPAVIAALIAKEEADFFRSIIDTLNSVRYSLGMIQKSIEFEYQKTK